MKRNKRRSDAPLIELAQQGLASAMSLLRISTALTQAGLELLTRQISGSSASSAADRSQTPLVTLRVRVRGPFVSVRFLAENQTAITSHLTITVDSFRPADRNTLHGSGSDPSQAPPLVLQIDMPYPQLEAGERRMIGLSIDPSNLSDHHIGKYRSTLRIREFPEQKLLIRLHVLPPLDPKPVVEKQSGAGQ